MIKIEAYEKEQERKDALRYGQPADFKTNVYYISDYGSGYLYDSPIHFERPYAYGIEWASQIIKEMFRTIITGKGTYPLYPGYGMFFEFKTGQTIDIIVERDTHIELYDYIEEFKKAINFKVTKIQTTHEDFVDAVRMITK